MQDTLNRQRHLRWKYQEAIHLRKGRVKHFISCSYKDLAHLSHHLRGITTDTYTHELAKKTEDTGICEWGHARLEFEEDVNNFDDQDHMDHVGEFAFSAVPAASGRGVASGSPR